MKFHFNKNNIYKCWLCGYKRIYDRQMPVVLWCESKTCNTGQLTMELILSENQEIEWEDFIFPSGASKYIPKNKVTKL